MVMSLMLGPTAEPLKRAVSSHVTFRICKPWLRANCWLSWSLTMLSVRRMTSSYVSIMAILLSSLAVAVACSPDSEEAWWVRSDTCHSPRRSRDVFQFGEFLFGHDDADRP